MAYNKGGSAACDGLPPGTERSWLPMRPHFTICSIPGCNQPHEARGLCHKHYARWWCDTHPSRRKRPRSLPPDLPSEEWRPVVGWEGWYEVSNLGRVRRIKEAAGTRRGHILRWAVGGKPPYPRVFLCREGKVLTKRVHRLVAEAFLGPCPEGQEVNHKDGDKANPRASNL